MTMEARPLQYIAEATGGRVIQGDDGAFVHRVSTDSRHVEPEDLFVALKGDRFDGHEFIAQAEQGGAVALLVDHSVKTQCAVVEVDDTRLALGRLAARYRRDFRVPVVGVAGSNGKTTTKDLLASILCRHHATVWSEASFNNDIGVPLTLLRMENFHHAAVLELGTNHPGELEPLVRMSAPNYGIITAIGREHLEFFGDLEGVAREEGMLGELLPSGGKLFLYGESQWSKPIAARSAAPVYTVGLGAGNDWRAEAVRVLPDGVVFKAVGAMSGEYRLGLLGRHQVTNALLAMAVAAELGVPEETVRAGLAECRPPQRRLQLSEANGIRILDDAYNANIDSVNASLGVLADLPCEGRRIVVLGSMAELGEETCAAHKEAGQSAAVLGIDALMAVGEEAEVTVAAARGAGLDDAVAFADNVAVGDALCECAQPGDVVLIKGSRAARLEEVGEYLSKRKT